MNCDMVNEYTYYNPEDNISSIIKRKLMRQAYPYNYVRNRLILYMLRPDEYRRKYLVPFEKQMEIRHKEKEKKQKVQERFKAMLKLGNKKKKKGLAEYVEQVRKKAQVTPKAS